MHRGHAAPAEAASTRTVATDASFEALSQSKTIEYIWERECPNLGSRGFVALSEMPALRGLGVSCKNLDDEALSTLPKFPALRELTPIDVHDDGFGHIGQLTRPLHRRSRRPRSLRRDGPGSAAGLDRLVEGRASAQVAALAAAPAQAPVAAGSASRLSCSPGYFKRHQ
jgi:hypothetical protein